MSENWRTAYADRIKTAQEAVADIKSGDKVYLGAFSGIARGLADALYDRKESLYAVELITISSEVALKLYEDEGYTPFSIRTPFPGAMEDKASEKGMPLYYTPVRLWEIGRWLESICRPDVAFIEVSSPNSQNHVSLGLGGGAINKLATANAGKVIFQINRNVPYVYGADNVMSLDEADLIVEMDDSVPDISEILPDETDRKIAGFIAPYIEDGATLQLGVDGISEALADILKDRKHLNMHTDIFGPALLKLLQCGAITNSHKKMLPGYGIYSRAMGGVGLYKYIHGNKGLYCASVKANDPKLIGQNEKMVSVQGGMVFDIFGKAKSMDPLSVKYHLPSNVQEYVRGSQLSEGGKSFLASPSVYIENGERKSSIVFEITDARGAIIEAADIQYVATEYGCVNLKLYPMDDRIRKMISLAHPDFRQELTEKAKALHLI